MNRYKAKALAEGVICSALSVVLVLIGIFFPSVATLLTMLAGVPMMYLGMRRGIRILVASILVSVLVVFLVTNHLVGSLLTAVMSFLPGMAMGYALRKRFTFSGIIFSGGGILLFGFVFQLALFNAMGDGQGVANMVNQTLDGVRQTTAEVLAGMQGQIPDQGQDLQAILNQTLDMVR
ncbi:MAG: DUF2232 domain-containing protein, partial [Clostridia bacterium]|nr:DUF2232 domain-containing protein [Clostridia bacterium]